MKLTIFFLALPCRSIVEEVPEPVQEPKVRRFMVTNENGSQFRELADPDDPKVLSDLTHVFTQDMGSTKQSLQAVLRAYLEYGATK